MLTLKDLTKDQSRAYSVYMLVVWERATRRRESIEREGLDLVVYKERHILIITYRICTYWFQCSSTQKVSEGQLSSPLSPFFSFVVPRVCQMLTGSSYITWQWRVTCSEEMALARSIGDVCVPPFYFFIFFILFLFALPSQPIPPPLTFPLQGHHKFKNWGHSQIEFPLRAPFVRRFMFFCSLRCDIHTLSSWSTGMYDF